MPQILKKNLTLKNLEKYLSIFILIAGLAYLSQHLDEQQISTKSGVVFILLEVAVLEIWESIKETSKKKQN